MTNPVGEQGRLDEPVQLQLGGAEWCNSLKPYSGQGATIGMNLATVVGRIQLLRDCWPEMCVWLGASGSAGGTGRHGSSC